ncbi:snRNA-activating protein complex subunit 1, partial [Danaus plexippus plexippus]
MSRYSHHIYKVYIADGFATDCDELIHRCLQLSKLDYQEFCKIWKDLDFSMIFHGRNSGAEIAELSEELVYISKQYLLKNTENFE